MKSRTRIGGAVLLLLSMVAFAAAVSASYDWRWGPPQPQWEDQGHDIHLTDRNGSRAADCLSIDHVYARAIFEAGYNIWVLSLRDGTRVDDPVQPDADAAGERPCVVIGTGCTSVNALWVNNPVEEVTYCYADWPSSWHDPDVLSDGAYNAAIAIGEGYSTGEMPYPVTYACYRAHPTGETDGVWFQARYGGSWNPPVQISTDTADQIAVSTGDPLAAFVAYHYVDGGDTHRIKVWRSTDGNFDNWTEVSGSPWSGVAQPSIAADGSHATLCWVKALEGGNPNAGGKIEVCWSDDFFSSHNGPVAVESYNSDPDLVYNAPTMAVVPTNSSPYHSNLLIVSELYDQHDSRHDRWLSAANGLFSDDAILWRQPEHYMPQPANVADQDANPCVDASVLPGMYTPPPKAYCFYTADGNSHRALYRLDADYVSNLIPYPPVHFDGIGRRIWLDLSGDVSYAARAGANVHAGPVLEDNSLQPILVCGGGLPALALDAAGERWVAFWRDDTLWCMLGDGSYKVVFAGSSSAVPGQPSIACYPNQANGVYVAGLVFPVYDTAGGASRIMFARACTSGVVLDTIESVQNLGDSLPSLSVFRSDTLVCTWQHGDSTIASMLCDYGPGTSGQPPVWTSPNLVSANGYHAMSRFDDNGTVLNVVWTRNNGSNYAVQRATCDLATTAFGNWSMSATPGDTGSTLKANPVFGGLGVTCWQQLVDGKWTIKGFVRGEEETFVANDTDAYHPHAVAESSAISPSIDQVRVHLLYTAGVAFEVDSGVYDTGETRYVCESLNVSHAQSDATKYNNGAKLLRKAASDSLFSVYSDLDNAVVFAWSADGDTWQRSVVATSRDNPAIAEDSTGKRWVVMHKAPVGMFNGEQEAYYRNGSSWTGPQTLFSAGAASPIGPASVAGASSTTSSFGYAAFLTTSGANKSVVVAKFNGTTVSTYTLATGTTLGDPAIAVEPYKTDSDHVHVIWDDNGIVKYSMAADSRGTSISTTWTTPYVLTGGGVTGHHPIIGANRSRIVVAWAQGTTADIYSRKRATSDAYNNWENAANLSNTANNASDWPTIAMGDTVVVAWEETRSGNDHDILACIEFGDTLNVADNATVSGYPHVIFQNQVSGDTLIPYLHLIMSECPSANYYEVGYNKLNLKNPSGEGQQSESSIPIPVKPVLASCSPNPFRNHTQISYALPKAGNVSLRVYDVTGRTVRTLASGNQRAGNYSVSWDARDSHGKQVPYGVYFYRLDTPGFRSVRKAVVAR